MSLKCPNCKLTSPDEAQRCDCGYDFQKKTVEKPYYKQAPSPPSGRCALGRCKCGTTLSPQQRRCPKCGRYVAPIFLLVLLVVQSLLGLYGLALPGLALLWGTQDEFAIVLPVSLGISAVFCLLVWRLSRGSTAAWHVWTVIMGLLVFAATISLTALISLTAFGGTGKDLKTPEGLPAIFFFGTLVYFGLQWRTAKIKKWQIASIIYLALTGVLGGYIALAHYGTKLFGTLLPAAIFCFAVALILVFTCSVMVRWWCKIRLGWTGDYIDAVSANE